MKIDRDRDICGLRPVLVRNLCRHDHFGIAEAAAALRATADEAPGYLQKLQQDGWIEETRPHQWEPTERGLRLAATRLIKRFPVAKGREIVRQVVDAAGEINAEPNNSMRIVEILLFGSVLTGADQDDAGDIDLIVITRSRTDIDQVRLRRLEQAERNAAPTGADLVTRVCWPSLTLMRRIKRISTKITLHGEEDLRIDMPRKAIYRYET